MIFLFQSIYLFKESKVDFGGRGEAGWVIMSVSIINTGNK